MATPDVSVVSLLEGAAVLCNDVSRATYTNPVLLPFLQIALNELQEHFELNDMPVTQLTSGVIPVNAGITEIGFDTAPPLPEDLIEIEQLWQRQRGVDPFIPVSPKREYLPHSLAGAQISSIIAWTWNENRIKFLPCNQNIDLKIDYIKALFPVVDVNSIIHVINSESFLKYRSAALASYFIGEDKPRATELNEYAEMSIERSTGIGIKGKQSIATRRRPFMASYKNRSVR